MIDELLQRATLCTVTHHTICDWIHGHDCDETTQNNNYYHWKTAIKMIRGKVQEHTIRSINSLHSEDGIKTGYQI